MLKGNRIIKIQAQLLLGVLMMFGIGVFLPNDLPAIGTPK
jgi:hypothetical protein